jgi:hypothetical protein
VTVYKWQVRGSASQIPLQMSFSYHNQRDHLQHYILSLCDEFKSACVGVGKYTSYTKNNLNIFFYNLSINYHSVNPILWLLTVSQATILASFGELFLPVVSSASPDNPDFQSAR